MGHRSLEKSTLEFVCAQAPALRVIDAERIWSEEVAEYSSALEVSELSRRIILFTSGTTGVPKGVVHSHGGYRSNQELFDSLFELAPSAPITLAIVNPLHHANSTAIGDWGMRRPGTMLELFPRYGRRYWRVLQESVDRHPGRPLIAPLVSRHFDLLESLLESGELEASPEYLQERLSQVCFLLGSAPVGPTTIQRLKRLTAHVPMVRFGSTELCLQALGTPRDMSDGRRAAAFERGLQRGSLGEAPGYYIGRPHPGFTEARVVRSLRPGEPGFMEECLAGEVGLLVVKSACVMLGYHGDANATTGVMEGDWYTGLGDICFALRAPEEDALDYYWVSREAGLLIKGGANYSCEQISSQIATLILDVFGLDADDVDVAVTALKRSSEHEDDGCLTVELKSPRARAKGDTLEAELIPRCREHLMKSAVPDWLRFGEIPRNFKGALQASALQGDFEAWFREREGEG